MGCFKQTTPIFIKEDSNSISMPKEIVYVGINYGDNYTYSINTAEGSLLAKFNHNTKGDFFVRGAPMQVVPHQDKLYFVHLFEHDYFLIEMGNPSLRKPLPGRPVQLTSVDDTLKGLFEVVVGDFIFKKDVFSKQGIYMDTESYRGGSCDPPLTGFVLNPDFQPTKLERGASTRVAYDGESFYTLGRSSMDHVLKKIDGDLEQNLSFSYPPEFFEINDGKLYMLPTSAGPSDLQPGCTTKKVDGKSYRTGIISWDLKSDERKLLVPHAAGQNTFIKHFAFVDKTTVKNLVGKVEQVV